MAAEGSGGAPYAAAVELKAAAEPKRIEPESGARPRWVRDIGTYARREIARAEDSASYG